MWLVVAVSHAQIMMHVRMGGSASLCLMKIAYSRKDFANYARFMGDCDLLVGRTKLKWTLSAFTFQCFYRASLHRRGSWYWHIWTTKSSNKACHHGEHHSSRLKKSGGKLSVCRVLQSKVFRRNLYPEQYLIYTILVAIAKMSHVRWW